MHTEQKPAPVKDLPVDELLDAVIGPAPVLGDRSQESGVCCGRQYFGCGVWIAENNSKMY